MNPATPTLHRSVSVFVASVPPSRTKYLLREVYACRSLEYWCGDLSSFDRDSFPWVCPAMGTDVILGRNSYHELVVGNPSLRGKSGAVSLGWVCGVQSYAYAVFCPTLSASLCGVLPSGATHLLSPPVREFESYGDVFSLI